jgi:hypothetical protein
MNWMIGFIGSSITIKINYNSSQSMTAYDSLQSGWTKLSSLHVFLLQVL